VTYASDTLGVVNNRKRVAMYDGRLGLIVDADLDQLFRWSGTTGHLAIHAIHGTGPTGDPLGNLLVVSGLEAKPTIRLFNVWIEKSLGFGSIRAGQFAAAQEFVGSTTANLFVNSTFGWPASFATDLPSGGPAYPLAAPGLRLMLTPAKDTSFLTAVFAGDPAGAGSGDPQSRDKFGLNSFRIPDSAFTIFELQQSLFGPDQGVTLKVGVWWHFGRFDYFPSPDHHS
jgi:porin